MDSSTRDLVLMLWLDINHHYGVIHIEDYMDEAIQGMQWY